MRNSGRQRLIHFRKEIRLLHGHRVDAKTDVCVIEDGILLVQKDKVIFCQLAESHFLITLQRQGQGYLHDIEPHFVAEAIATFHQNNGNRRLAGLSKLTYHCMPGIVMIGSAVVFYLIPVTDTLKEAISAASYPVEEMIVFQFIPLYQTVPITAIMEKGCGHWRIGASSYSASKHSRSLLWCILYMFRTCYRI